MALYDDLMAKIKPLPNGNVATEHLRGDVIKRMARLGLKDDPIVEIDKAIAQVQKLQDYYPERLNLKLDTVKLLYDTYALIVVLELLPSGFDEKSAIDMRRLVVISAMTQGVFTSDTLRVLEELKAEFTPPQPTVSTLSRAQHMLEFP